MEDYTPEDLCDLQTLAVGQCADLKKEEDGYRYWLCRVSGLVAVERLVKGRWETVRDCH